MPILMLALALAPQAAGRAPSQLVRAYIGSDGGAHVVDGAGRDVALPKQPGQVAASDPRLSPDRRFAGWLIEEANCCTSYPIPLRLALYWSGRVTIISDGLMIYDWTFVAGRRVAISTGTVHGATARHLALFDARTGRRLGEWTGPSTSAAPAWAATLRQ